MKLVIFDIDGVLADNSHRNHLIPKEQGKTENWRAWNKLGLFDAPIVQMCNLASAMVEQSSIQVGFLTARCEEGHFETLEWLRANIHPMVDPTSLMMRQPDYNVSAPELKVQACRALKSNHNIEILTIFDDDPKVVEALVEAGFPAILVEPLSFGKCHSPKISPNMVLPHQAQLQ